jgi:hypothetical protein
MKEHNHVCMRIHPFYGPWLDSGDSKGQDGSFKSLLFDSSMKDHAAFLNALSISRRDHIAIYIHSSVITD